MGISKGHNMYNKAVSRLPRYISQDFCDPLCDQGGLNTSKFAYLTHFESVARSLKSKSTTLPIEPWRLSQDLPSLYVNTIPWQDIPEWRERAI